MVKRVVAAAAACAVSLLLVASGAGAQTYPPPANSLTVDDPTPAQGQTIAVTLATCRPGTFALIGIDIFLMATPPVDADGAARASLVVPSWAPPGEHWVSGACLGADWLPLFLSTRIDVEPGTGGGDGGGDRAVAGSGRGEGAGPAAGSTGTARAAGAGAGSSSMPSLDALAAPVVPPDAALLYQMAALYGGPAGADDDAGRGASRSEGAADDAAGDDGPGLLGTIARVAFGVLALGGVPVAMAFSRGRGPAVFGGRFAAP